jgi:sec-independent protein translocase protein TatA
MGSLSIWHWLLIAVVVLVAFGGAGKIPRMMGDMAKGIKAFKTGMREDDDQPAQPPATTPQQPVQPAPAAQGTAQPQPAPQPAPAQQPRAHAQ